MAGISTKQTASFVQEINPDGAERPWAFRPGTALAGPVAAGAYGGAALLAADLTPAPLPVNMAGFALTGGAVLAGIAATRTAHRFTVTENLVGALAPLIGAPLPGRVKIRGWTSPWGGDPRRVTLTYDSRAASDDIDWRQRILTTMSRRTGREYEVASHDAIHRKLVLKLAAPASAETAATVPFLAQRATEIVDLKLGVGSRTKITWDEGNLVALDVDYAKGVELAINSATRSSAEKAISTMLPGRWRTIWDLEADHVRFEWRPVIPDDLERDLSEPTAENLRLLPFGVEEDNRVCYWDLRGSAGTPHFMCTGATGAGKTALMRTLVTEICRRGWQIRICDPKRVEFVGLKAWPNVEIVATTVTSMVAVIHQTYLEMERRYAAIEHGEAVEGEFEPLFLLLDEFRYFFSKVNSWYAQVKATGGSKNCPILDEVFQIAILGRTADVHLILGTQRPDASWLGGDMRDQYGARASLGRLSPDGAKMMWDSYRVGTSVPRRKPGRGTTIGPDDKPVEFQSFWTPNPSKAKESDLAILEKLRPATATWERYVVLPLPEVDEAGELIPDKGRYADYLLADYVPAREHPEMAEYMPDPLAAATAGAVDADEDLLEVKDDDYEELEYGPVRTMRASTLEGRSGYLLEIEDGHDVWAVVESAERDATDEDAIAILWRSDDDGDDCGLLVVDSDETVTVRTPLEVADDDA